MSFDLGVCMCTGRAGRDGEEAERSGGGSRQLPREQGWLLDEAVSRLGVKAVGPGFVMTRPGSQGLVKSPGGPRLFLITPEC